MQKLVVSSQQRRVRPIDFYEISVPTRLTLACSSSSTSISPHRHGLLVSNNIAQVRKSAVEFPAVDSLGGFAGVLEGDTEVSTAGAGRFAGLNLGGCVANLDRWRIRG